ncbi:MAG: NADH-quinone oxidoreductase subunit J [Cytophagaceae bacterium]
MNDSALILFYFFALTTLCGGVYILLSDNIVHSALALLVSLLGTAFLYLFLNMDFLMVSQIVVYVGGVILLIVFGIMISKRMSGPKQVNAETKNIFTGVFVALVLGTILMHVIRISEFSKMKMKVHSYAPESAKIKDIGVNIMTGYIFPFELAAIILLVALIGAAYIAAGIHGNKKDSK